MADEKQIPTLTPEQESLPQAPTVHDRRRLPEGVVPRQAQGYVVAGLAVLILMAVMFSKNHPKPTPASTGPTSPTASTDVNQRKIQELEQDLTADQRQSEQQAQTQKSGIPASPGTNAAMTAANQTSGVAPATQLPPPSETPRDPIADAEKALAFKARFASNLVSGNDTIPGAASSSAPPTAGTGNADKSAAPSTMPTSLHSDADAKHPPEVNVNSAHGQPYVLFEGTTIDTSLVNRLDGEFVGSVKVMVTNPVYSRDRQHVLIPEGTFILGNAQKVSGFGQKRLAVAFHRMIMPDGYNVDLDQFRGLDQAGETGLKDKVNNHYLEIFGASIALGIIAGAAQATTDSGYEENGSSMYRQGMAESLAASGANVLDKFINIPPTITIREGHRIKIYLTQDMLLPAYENHDMPGVM
ncbi:TrbI/VirB10 family protein [Silvibacterium dinghuense]|uniref:TrbI/VirB10 family protein n=1 Tax=Silvibacterium dinghuense TaxID=1560006 RepID=A0A4V1NVY2_9BACT|nr:TrbI/VirB10 family protein [Silvibacterium dinghuense]RXS97512.1 TrbI/VirB10 family protein [Silvibacterium dinghuense]GGG99613.1 channel protein VirB10 [Silvibacterium dinghuense]